jgi:hypothetical protein
MTAAVCACSARLWGWRWRGQPVTCWRPAPGSPSMCLAQTWHIPGVDLPRTPARPAWPPVPGPAAGRGSSTVPQPEPGHRPPAASPPPPRGQSCHQPQPPAIFRLTTAGPQLPHTRTAAVSDLDPDTPPAARTATVTVSPAALEPLCRTLLANSSLTSSAAPYSPGYPGPGTPAVNARATRACSARPPSRSPGQPP